MIPKHNRLSNTDHWWCKILLMMFVNVTEWPSHMIKTVGLRYCVTLILPEDLPNVKDLGRGRGGICYKNQWEDEYINWRQIKEKWGKIDCLQPLERKPPLPPPRNTTMEGVRNTQEENVVFADFNIDPAIHTFVNDMLWPSNHVHSKIKSSQLYDSIVMALP